MNKPKYDYSAYRELPNETELLKLSELVIEQQEQALVVLELEELLEAAKDKLRDLEEFKLPELMESLGFSQFTTTSGVELELKENTYAAISKKNEPAAFAWLESTDNGAIIKSEVKVVMNAGEENEADKLCELLEEEGFYPTKKRAVHAQTLKAFVKEQLEEGVDIPIEPFGIFKKNIVKVKSK